MTSAPVTSDLTTEVLALAAGPTRPALVTVGLPPEAAERLASAGLPALRRRATVAWEPPLRHRSLFGFGRALVREGCRCSPFSDALPALRHVTAHARSGNVARAARPRLFGGGRFAAGGGAVDHAWDAFGGWQFAVPGLLLAIEDGVPFASFTIAPGELPAGDSLAAATDRLAAAAFATAMEDPRDIDGDGALDTGKDLSRQGWFDIVEQGLADIRAGLLRKVVLARSSGVTFPDPIDTGHVLSRLAGRYPGCYVYAYRGAGTTWMGASPELLCSLEDGLVLAASLAGSRPRGRDPETDAALTRELLESEKELTEHALVARDVCEALSELCTDISVPGGPRVMKVHNIQHLYTPISGRPHPGLNVADVASRLHPTPAVAGWPRPDALAAIERIEGMDRGWYAGPIGWMDMDGHGEFAVGLRSALVRGREARLFAGGGIVVGSEPAQEYAETETKFQALREALACR